MSDARSRYIRDHAPTLLLYAATRRPASEHEQTDLERAIRYAAALYDRLTAAGHTPDSRPAEGAPRAPKTRKSTDHVGALSPDQAAAFERFYRAYGVPRGKQRAAARWAELAPDAALARRICEAAERDAAAPRPADAVRKYPEGWLSERRWEDVPAAPAPGAGGDDRAARVRELLSVRAGLAQLASGLPSPEISAQLARVDADLAALGIAVDSAGSAEAARRRRPGSGLTPLAAPLGAGAGGAAQ